MHDGDTLTIEHHVNWWTENLKIRLARIDAPELKQKFGKEARDRLMDLCDQQTVHVKPTGTDLHRRIVAEISKDNTSINEALVRDGYARWYQAYDKHDDAMRRLQSQANSQKRGLWNDPSAVPPWEFRHPQPTSTGCIFPNPFAAPIYFDPSAIASLLIIVTLVPLSIWLLRWLYSAMSRLSLIDFAKIQSWLVSRLKIHPQPKDAPEPSRRNKRPSQTRSLDDWEEIIRENEVKGEALGEMSAASKKDKELAIAFELAALKRKNSKPKAKTP